MWSKFSSIQFEGTHQKTTQRTGGFLKISDGLLSCNQEIKVLANIFTGEADLWLLYNPQSNIWILNMLFRSGTGPDQSLDLAKCRGVLQPFKE